ncbi:MAG: zinc-ribbon domain containing protein [Pyrinomonadaceae bacterium]|nr:zinc-ribbon domain containing protein [Pyrinomonadaceae bacterium]
MSDDLFIGLSGTASSGSSPDNEFEDKSIRCIDCGSDFTWTSGEQVFFRDKNLQNPPKRCKGCKQAKNERLAVIAAAQASGIKQRIEVSVKCARCSESTTVPFYPSQGRPVYCRSCFLEMNPSVLLPDQPSDPIH